MDRFLPKGYKVKLNNQGTYTIKSVIGCGASTVAYEAEYSDNAGHTMSRILKEFNPRYISLIRSDDGMLECAEKDKLRFIKGMERFVFGCDRQYEVRSIPQIMNQTPPLEGPFDANGTKYLIVSKYIGQTYNDIVTELTLEERVKVCLSVAKLVACYHRAGYLCLDIKPDNIFILPETKELLQFIDFDSVRTQAEVAFGNSVSYTKTWAAPEQINPYHYGEVSEASDIYTIGELVFWSVFERHSTTAEHRGFSVYPFDCVSVELGRSPVRRILEQLFRKTLRSSVRSRFTSVDDVILLLEALAEETSKKEYIVTSQIRPKSFFVGRDAELAAIEEALQKDDIVFVSGIAGIGKSEIVKQYVMLHRNEYQEVLFWTFEGNLDSMVARDSSVSICNFARLEEESDAQYARRKMKRLKELLTHPANLIVIDNMDRLIEELAQQETWTFLMGLPGKMLIATRSAESLYTAIEIAQFPDIEDSVRLFGEYCPFVEDERPDVERIISSVGGHTLLVELLAHHTKATHSTPKQTFQKLQNSGISSLPTASVRLLKDGWIESNSVFAHVEKVFSMDTMSEEQILLLGMVALMPVDGVQTEKFSTFYSLEDYEDLNWLIHHGWIHVGFDYKEVISVHPTIASVAMECLKANTGLLGRLYTKGTKAIMKRDSDSLNESDWVLLADSLALATTDRFAIKNRCAGVFIGHYVGGFSRYGNAELKNRLIDFAIDSLECNSREGQYNASLQQCYLLKASLLWNLLQYDQAISVCERHLKIAQAADDIYLATKWCIRLSGYYQSRDEVGWRYLKLYWQGIAYLYRIAHDVGKRKPRFWESDNLKNLGYGYTERDKKKLLTSLMISCAEWMENNEALVLFCTKESSVGINLLKRAEKIRADFAPNSYERFIDKARIAFITGDYQKAESLLLEVIEHRDKKKLADTATMYRIHQFMANIALRKNPIDYSYVLDEFERCLQISDCLFMKSTYMVRLELGYQGIACGEIERVKRLNMDLLRETRILAPEVRKTYYADALRNMAYLYYVQGDRLIARNMLNGALREYNNSNAPSDLICFGRARTYRLLAEWCYANDKEPDDVRREASIAHLEMSIDWYKTCVGLHHPEAVSCLERLEEIKSQQ